MDTGSDRKTNQWIGSCTKVQSCEGKMTHIPRHQEYYGLDITRPWTSLPPNKFGRSYRHILSSLDSL